MNQPYVALMCLKYNCKKTMHAHHLWNFELSQFRLADMYNNSNYITSYAKWKLVLFTTTWYLNMVHHFSLISSNLEVKQEMGLWLKLIVFFVIYNILCMCSVPEKPVQYLLL